VIGLGFLLVLGGLIVAGSFDNPVHAIAVAGAVIGGVAAAVGMIDSVITPVFEFVPDGQQRRRRALHVGRRIVSWLADRTASGAIEFGLGVLATVIYYHYFK